MFVLKVISEGGLLRPDPDEEFSQRSAFYHLCPTGYCMEDFKEILVGLAALHGWGVEISSPSAEMIN